MNRRRKRSSSPGGLVKRYKSEYTSIEHVSNVIDSEKGEAVAALYSVFDHASISFDTRRHKAQSQTFITYLNLKGYSFIGCGKNKTASRADASKVALLFLLHADDFCRNKDYNYCPIPQQLVEHAANSLPDIIASLVLSKYGQLRNNSREGLPWFKMIAGIVMVRNRDPRNAEVIVLSTGSKCIEPKNVKLDGSVIIDSHAETVVRRSFQYFLYSQLLSPNLEETILERYETKFRLKPDICLYLFVNSAPCGDSRIFTVSDKDSECDKHPNRLSRGVLRIKLDGGNSTVPLTNVKKYNSDRLMVMSCSDKLLKYNALGLQGSLLSTFVEPIYLEGIVIGDSFRESHLTRALYERADDIELPKPFNVHRPTVYGIEKVQKVVTKSPRICVNWICGSSVEIFRATDGRTKSGELSRLCKRNLFRSYLTLQNRQNNIYSYADCKRECQEYQAAKRCFYEFLDNKRLGKWIERVPSFDAFVVE